MAVTVSYSFTLPSVGGDTNIWGGFNNNNWTKVDQLLSGVLPLTGVDINSGTIDGASIGAAVASTGRFTTITTTGNATFGGSVSFATALTGTQAVFSSASPQLELVDTDTGNIVRFRANNTSLLMQADPNNAIVGASARIQVGGQTAAETIIEAFKDSIDLNRNTDVNGNLFVTGELSGDTCILAGSMTSDSVAAAGAITAGGALDGTSLGATLDALITAKIAAANPVKAWASFNGTTTGTFSPTAGSNVASITRNGAGDYTITFATALVDADYAVVAMGDNSGGDFGQFNIVSKTSTAVRVRNGVSSGYFPIDRPIVSIVVVR